MAWARRPVTFKRQCVFVGSTNEYEFLIDKTGNRRWWPIMVNVPRIDNPRLRANINDIWGAAVAVYKAMREQQPHGYLDLSLSDEATAYAAHLQDAASIRTEADLYAADMAAWLDKKFERSEIANMHEGTRSHDFDDMDPAKQAEMVHLDWTCVYEVREAALDLPAKSGGQYESNQIGAALRKNGWVTAQDGDGLPVNKRHPRFGIVKVFYPGEATLARWAEEDAKGSGDDDLDLV